MKYIKTINEDGEFEIFLFPSNIDHDTFAESINRIKNKSWGNWKRIYREVATAGFVSPELTCFGKSETLNRESSPNKDTKLLRKQLNMRC